MKVKTVGFAHTHKLFEKSLTRRPKEKTSKNRAIARFLLKF